MDIKCPHCGTEYEIDKAVFGQFVKCEVCGNGFVAGASSSRASGSGKGETTSTQISTQRNVQSESVKCPHCGVMYEVSKSKAGKLLKCRKCGQLFVCAFVKNGAQSTNSRRGQTFGRSDQHWNVIHEPVQSKSKVRALLLVGVIGVVLVAVAVFSSLQALSKNSRLIRLEEFYEPTSAEVKRGRDALSKQEQSVADLKAIGRGVAPFLLKAMGKVFDCPHCGKQCKIPSGLNYKVGEERDCLCPYCHNRFWHTLR